MANHIYVFCRSADLLPMRELGQYIGTIGLLDQKPQFKPSLDSPEANDPEWTFLEIIYREDKRPIHLHRLFRPERKQPAINDAVSSLSHHGCSEEHPESIERIRSAQQVFHFELGLELTDDCWEMLDATESYIAKALDGIVVASDGVYDDDLQPICTWK